MGRVRWGAVTLSLSVLYEAGIGHNSYCESSVPPGLPGIQLVSSSALWCVDALVVGRLSNGLTGIAVSMVIGHCRHPAFLPDEIN